MIKLRFWKKIISLDNRRLVKRVFLEEKKQLKPNTWSFNMKLLMFDLGLSKEWTSNYTSLSSDEWNSFISAKLRKRYIAKWEVLCLENKKLGIYSEYGGSFGFKNYLNHSNINQRDKLARIRSGSNILRIDRGRRHNLLRKERTCLLCRQDTEDEIHFLFSCSFFKKPRLELYFKITNTLLENKLSDLLIKWNNNKIWFLFGSSNNLLINKLVMGFISSVMRIRNNFIPSSTSFTYWGR